MNLHIKAFATLGRFLPENPEAYEAPEGITVGSLADQLRIPEEELHLIFVNGRRAERSQSLQPGDRVGFFPAVGGG